MAKEQVINATFAVAAKPESAARISISASSRCAEPQSTAAIVLRSASSMTSGHLPVLDLGPFITGQGSADDIASLGCQVADCLHRTSCLVVRDPRVAISDSNRFLDLVERYFDQSHEAKLADARPHLHFQVR